MSSADRNAFLAFAQVHTPFDQLSDKVLSLIADKVIARTIEKGDVLVGAGMHVDAWHIVADGSVELVGPQDEPLAHLTMGDAFGARELLRREAAPYTAHALRESTVFLVPSQIFADALMADSTFAAHFGRSSSTRTGPRRPEKGDRAILSLPIRTIMTPAPVTVSPDETVRTVASLMREKRISCLLVLDEGGILVGIVTASDLAHRVVADGRNPDSPVRDVMTPDPVSLEPRSIGFDALMLMTERRIGHLPITENGRPIGIITQSDFIRRQAVSLVYLLRDLKEKESSVDLAAIVAKVPQLVAQLVGSGMEAHNIGRIVTAVTDALTRRLLELAEARLGQAPVPFLWLACGSQGRQEQTAVSDQDNCLFLDDAYDEEAHGPYFEALARSVCDGLNEAGYVYCPGEMMATNPRWRKPVSVWRSYFDGWIAKPDPMAQMLASVMFDLRPIAGNPTLFGDLARQTLEKASGNSIFRAHMISNSLKHTPPLGLFRGLAVIRSGEHKDRVDLKHNGIVPIVDLARAFALEGRIEAVNTRDRLIDAQDRNILSQVGALDLIDAYDLIANLRLEHQAQQIRDGLPPDNYIAPASLSALQRNHLKDAFGIVKTMQAALGYGRSA